MIDRQQGFTVIEMIIGIFISAILMTASLTIYNQISKSGITIQKITSVDTQIMILHNRLTTDLQGLIPLWFTTQHYEQLKKNIKKDAKGNDEATPAAPSIGSKKENDFLYAQSNNGQFEFLTFITSNALQTFGDISLRTVRVVYLLQHDPAHPELFQLMRKENDNVSADFDIEKLKTDHFSEIANKINSCSIEYGFVKPDSEKENTEKSTKLTFVSEWGQQQEQQKKDTEKRPNLPDIIKFTIKIAQKSDQEPKTYELFCTIPTCHATTLKSFAQQRKEQTKNTSTQASKADDAKNEPSPENNAPTNTADIKEAT